MAGVCEVVCSDLHMHGAILQAGVERKRCASIQTKRNHCAQRGAGQAELEVPARGEAARAIAFSSERTLAGAPHRATTPGMREVPRAAQAVPCRTVNHRNGLRTHCGGAGAPVEAIAHFILHSTPSPSSCSPIEVDAAGVVGAGVAPPAMQHS